MNTTTFIGIGQWIIVRAHLQDTIQVLGSVLENGNLDLKPLRDSMITRLFQAKHEITTLSGNPEYLEVIEGFELHNVFSDENMTQVITILKVNDSSGNIHRDNAKYNVFINAFVRLRTFADCIFALTKLVDSPRRKLAHEGEAILDFEVLDLGNGYSFSRIEDVLHNIHILYEQIAGIYGLNPESISIAFFDSGSPFILGIKGDSKVIKEMKTLLIGIWDKLRFTGLEGRNRKLESLDAHLDLEVKLNELKANNKITSERADQYSVLVFDSAKNLMRNGAAPREMLPTIQIENRDLLRQRVETKLLTQSSAITFPTSSAVLLPPPSVQPNPQAKKDV